MSPDARFFHKHDQGKNPHENSNDKEGMSLNIGR